MKRIAFIYRHPWVVIAVICAITVFFGVWIPGIELDNDTFHFIPDNHPERMAFKNTEDLFGEAIGMVVGIEVETGSIFDRDVLGFVDKLTKKIEELDQVGDVMSVTNADYIAATAEGMEVVPIVDSVNSDEDIKLLKSRLLSWDMYEGVLYSSDFKATQIIVPIKSTSTEDEREAIYRSIKQAIADYAVPGVKTYVAGTPAMTVLISHNMNTDIKLLIPLVILVLTASLFLSFRRLGGVILPLVTVVISTIWTVGLMALLGIKLSLIGTVIPVLMVAVGSAYGIHIISHYYDLVRDKGTSVSEDVHVELIVETVRDVGKPVLLAAITTMVGFGSLASSQVRPIQEFGIFSAFGVLAALIVAVTFIPSILLVRHRALKSAEQKNGKEDGVDRFMLFLYRLFSSKRASIILLAIIAIGLGIYGTTLLDKDNVLVDYFKPNTEIRKADKFFREKFTGTKSFEIIVDGKASGALTDPDVLVAMDGLSSYLKDKYPEVKKVISFSDFLKRINQVLNTPPEQLTEEKTTPIEKESSLSVSQQEGSNSGFSSLSFFSDDSKNNNANTSSSEQDKTASSDTTYDNSLFFFDSSDTTDSPSDTSRQGESVYSSHSNIEASYTTAKPGISDIEFARLLNTAYAMADSQDISARELVKLINRELNYMGAAYYEIPHEPKKYSLSSKEELSNLISQYLLLFSGNLSSWTDDAIEPSMAKISVQISDTGSIKPYMIAKDAEEYAKRHFPQGYSIRTSGVAKVEYALTDLIVKSQVISIVASLALVFLIIVINFRSVVAGIYGLIPLGITVLLNFGIMGILGIKLDISTSMVASLAIGIGIDYTIHFLNYYHRERLRTGDSKKASSNSIKGVGKAIVFNAVSVAAGFLVLLLSRFTPLNYLGLLIAITMLTSSTASISLLPALFSIKEPAFLRKPINSYGGEK
ncbi:MMPL family transporter [Spirochaetia bacterium 38H-sp]|uniref:MMPL family transporter n=1 Tax=Rarispira pelagica TaxID=3141764 RepID=A0ABU9UBI5_9SPIR